MGYCPWFTLQNCNKSSDYENRVFIMQGYGGMITP